jgi:hypothetical protein
MPPESGAEQRVAGNPKKGEGGSGPFKSWNSGNTYFIFREYVERRQIE